MRASQMCRTDNGHFHTPTLNFFLRAEIFFRVSCFIEIQFFVCVVGCLVLAFFKFIYFYFLCALVFCLHEGVSVGWGRIKSRPLYDIFAQLVPCSILYFNTDFSGEAESNLSVTQLRQPPTSGSVCEEPDWTDTHTQDDSLPTHSSLQTLSTLFYVLIIIPHFT